MRKSVVVTVLKRTDEYVRMELSGHYNERMGQSLPDAVVTVSHNQFERLARDHGMTADQFPEGQPVRVSEPA